MIVGRLPLLEEVSVFPPLSLWREPLDMGGENGAPVVATSGNVLGGRMSVLKKLPKSVVVSVSIGAEPPDTFGDDITPRLVASSGTVTAGGVSVLSKLSKFVVVSASVAEGPPATTCWDDVFAILVAKSGVVTVRRVSVLKKLLKSVDVSVPVEEEAPGTCGNDVSREVGTAPGSVTVGRLSMLDDVSSV